MVQAKITDKALREVLFRQVKNAIDTFYDRCWKRGYFYAHKIFEAQVHCEDDVYPDTSLLGEFTLEHGLKIWRKNVPKIDFRHYDVEGNVMNQVVFER